MLDFILEILVIFLVIATLPGSIELLLLTIGSLLPRRKKTNSVQIIQKLAVVIPAHNEESHIAKTLESLKQNGEDFSIVVVADNCTDKTAEIAQRYGARVIERHDKELRGKHYALNYAFSILLQQDFEAFLIVDADCVCAPNLIREIQSSFSKSTDAIQVRYALDETGINFKQRLLRIAFNAVGYLRPLGRQGWNLSVGILGTGFAVRKCVLENVKIPTDSVVEDACFHLRMVQRGYFVDFNPHAYVLSEVPKTLKNQVSQRSRWEGGRIKLMFDELPSAIKAVLNGNLRMIEPCLDLMLLPLSYHAILLILLLVIPMVWGQTVAIIGLLILAIHVAVSLAITKASWKDYAALALAPLFLVAKLFFVFKIIDQLKSKPLWAKTSREIQHNKTVQNNHKEKL